MIDNKLDVRTGMTVTQVRTREVTLPLSRPVRNGTMLLAERAYTFVDVVTASGLTGTACGYTRGAPLAWIVREQLAPVVMNRSPFESELLWRALFEKGVRFLGTSGAFMRSLSLVDIALWDLRGKIVGHPVASLLGGQAATFPVMAAAGYYRDGLTEDDLQAEYADLVSRGFRQLKVMAGGLDPRQDARRVNAIREALPADATLAVDVNGVWTSAAEALEFLDALDQLPFFLEDPFRPGCVAALEDLRRHTATPIAVGEWESGVRRFRELLDRNVVDILRLDATAIGGATEWLRVAALATAYDKTILPHFFPGVHAQLAVAAETILALEVVPASTGADNFDDLVDDAWWSQGPKVAVPDAPGFGIEWSRKEGPDSSRN